MKEKSKTALTIKSCQNNGSGSFGTMIRAEDIIVFSHIIHHVILEPKRSHGWAFSTTPIHLLVTCLYHEFQLLPIDCHSLFHLVLSELIFVHYYYFVYSKTCCGAIDRGSIFVKPLI